MFDNLPCENYRSKKVTLLKLEKKILGSGLFLLLIAFGSQALTLGRANSSALIGRSLDLAIAVQMDAGETAASLCLDADVFHGDARQDPGRVKVLVESTAQPNMFNVRVQSATAVDEPVVTVYLRTGCGQKTTRRYVLLADFPSELAESPVLPKLNPVPVPAAGAVLAAPAAASDKGSIAPRKPRSSEPQRASNQPAPTKTAVLSSKGVAVKSGRPVERRAGQPSLQLDPLELFSDRISDLNGAMTFDAPPDALESIQKIKTLEDSLKSLRLSASKNEASLNDLQTRLQKAESNGFSSQTGYMLMALVLACLAALAAAAVLLWRGRQTPVADGWWDEAGAEVNAVPLAPVVKKTVDTVPAKLATDPVLSQWSESSHFRSRSVSKFESPELQHSRFGVNVNMTEMSDSAFDDFMPPGTQSQQSSKVAETVIAVSQAARPARNLNSEKTLDIRQQAEFFVSLGQTERAAQLLRREIKESAEANPLVYLDLLALFHSLGLKSEFQQLRENFELLFCCRIPAFTFFKNRSLDLESYPEVLAHIVGIWSQPGILAWLESCIFQTPGRSGSLGFDLAAFQDLLFLHAVARLRSETPDLPDRGNPGAGVAFSSPSPSVKAQPATLQQELPPFDALDLDLSSPADAVKKVEIPAYSLDEPLPFLMPSDFQFDGKIKRT